MPTLPRPSRSLTVGNFDDRLHAGALECDLTKLRFVDAYGLVGSACAILAALDADELTPIAPPHEQPMQTHLTLMGFRDFLVDLGYAVELPEATSPDRPDVLVPLQRVERQLAAERLHHLVWEQLRRHTNPQVLNATLEGLLELLANVLEHAGSEAVVMGHVYRGGEPPHHENRVQVVIGDAGKGIRGSLIEGGLHEPVGDAQAIGLALEYLVSSVDDPGRGQGLFTTAAQVTELQGTLVIRSGEAKTTVSAGGDHHETVPFLAGTLVCMSLPV